MDQRHIAANEDPVCGMTVDVDQARVKGLALEHKALGARLIDVDGHAAHGILVRCDVPLVHVPSLHD